MSTNKPAEATCNTFGHAIKWRLTLTFIEKFHNKNVLSTGSLRNMRARGEP